MYKNLTITSILGAIAVILGAFGAHMLKNKLNIDEIKSFETGVKYQLLHAIVLLFVNTYNGFTLVQKNKISIFFIVGILFFSGSIYAIYLLNIPTKFIWFITPLGGALIIIGWLLMCFNFYKKVTR